jgi:pterin-4a-carbinolamine dehydratase
MTQLAVLGALSERPAWALVGDRLVREHDCGSWDAAFAALAPIAAAAERLDQRTHRPRGISQLDLDLADAIDAVLPPEPA